MKVAVIGAGAAGLAAAYHLGKNGADVSTFEAEPVLGGLASWFEIGGHHLEKYYHFLCLNDSEYLAICRELHLEDRIQWQRVRMGYYYNGKRYNFGDPWDLFLFPHLRWNDKIRFAKTIQAMKRQPFSDWRHVAQERAVPWLIETFGENVFRIVHAPLVSGKFGEYKNNLSAAWIWARIHRVGKSRSRWLNLETYGYLQGGSYELLERLAEEIKQCRGKIFLNRPVKKIYMGDSGVTGVETAEGREDFDAVISTIPFQILRKMLPDISHAYFRQLDTAEYYGVTCLVLRLKRKLTPHFWLNINDPRIEIPGIIEYTNLNPLSYLGGDALVYIPQYLDPSDARFALSKDELLRHYLPYLKMINPRFTQADIVEAHYFKNTHAQPLCDMGFHERIPEKRTPIRGLYLTDSYQLHPDDRTVSSSLKMGREAALLLLDDVKSAPAR